MAQAFIGRWKVDLASASGQKEVMTAYGMDHSFFHYFCEQPIYLEVIIEGETWTNIWSITDMGSKTYRFKLGEEIIELGMHGHQQKSVWNLENGVLIETHTRIEGNSPPAIGKREVKDNVMVTKVTVGDAVMKCNMIRC